MNGLIVAAGRGSRMSGTTPYKPLLPVLGVPLIARVLGAARDGGVRDVVVITGYGADEVTRFLDRNAADLGVHVTSLFNPEWSRGNGYSLLRAHAALAEPFALMMCDHLFDPTILADLLLQPPEPEGVVLAVDRGVDVNHRIQADDVTRVAIEGADRIAAIGRGLPHCDAYDTGLFLCTPGVFAAVRESIDAGGDGGISDAVRHLARQGRARAWDVGGRFWMDVDDERDLRLLEELLAPARHGERER